MKKLSNGWFVGPETLQEQEGGGYEATKDAVRSILEGKAKEITLVCYCQVREGFDGAAPHYTKFDVETNEDGTRITIGCTDFTPEDIELVKEWLEK